VAIPGERTSAPYRAATVSARDDGGTIRGVATLRTRSIAALATGVLILGTGCGTVREPADTASPTGVTGSDQQAPPVPTSSVQAASFPSGLSDQTLSVDGVERRYRIHVPADLNEPTALIVVLHGGGGDGTSSADDPLDPLAVFREVADREDAVVVYPQGLPAKDRAGDRAGWDDCRGDSEVANGADDTTFLASLITGIGGAFGLDASHTLVTGTSNGAQMAQSLAFARPELIGALAISAGNLPFKPKPGPCTDGPSQAVPILMTHGTADEMMPYGGGCVANLSGECNRGRVISSEATLARWLAINGVTSADVAPTIVEVNSGDSGPANRFDYVGTAHVQWWRLDGAGHPVPSKLEGISASRVVGPRNTDVEFAEIVWNFFAPLLPAN
jgi:polyhydroxybutyrate depolymerase